MRTGSKSSLRKFLVSPDRSDAASIELDERTTNMRVLLDGFALWRIFKPRKTYKEWLSNIITKLQSTYTNASQIEIINDHYLECSIKSATRSARGAKSVRVYLESADQIMPQGKAWDNFFNNIDNKTDLVKLALEFFLKV